MKYARSVNNTTSTYFNWRVSIWCASFMNTPRSTPILTYFRLSNQMASWSFISKAVIKTFASKSPIPRELRWGFNHFDSGDKLNKHTCGKRVKQKGQPCKILRLCKTLIRTTTAACHGHSFIKIKPNKYPLNAYIVEIFLLERIRVLKQVVQCMNSTQCPRLLLMIN